VVKEHFKEKTGKINVDNGVQVQQLEENGVSSKRQN